MAESLNQDEATQGVWASGQMCDAVSDLSPAMSAPGSLPAQDVSPFRRDPDPAEVHLARHDRTVLVHGARDGAEPGRWDDLSGSREPWEP
jgi:hypothetical protein